MGSGKGWTAQETVAACKAYVSASEDPRNGNGRKKDVFANQVLDCYKRYMTKVKHNDPQVTFSDRTADAVMQRYRKARCEGLKFEGIVASIKAKKPTGDPSEEDIERASLAVYNGDARIGDMYTYISDRTVDPGPDFPFRDALWYLRNTNAWSLVVLSKQNKETAKRSIQQTEESIGEHAASDGGAEGQSPGNRSSSSSAVPTPTHPNPGNVNGKKERPVGAKRALEISKQVSALHRGAEGIEKLAEASYKRTKVAEDMLQVEKQQSMIALFSMPGTDPAVQQRFLQLSQLKALAALEKEVSPPESLQPTPVQNGIIHHNQTQTLSPSNNVPAGSISSILNG